MNITGIPATKKWSYLHILNTKYNFTNFFANRQVHKSITRKMISDFILVLDCFFMKDYVSDRKRLNWRKSHSRKADIVAILRWWTFLWKDQPTSERIYIPTQTQGLQITVSHWTITAKSARSKTIVGYHINNFPYEFKFAPTGKQLNRP